MIRHLRPLGITVTRLLLAGAAGSMMLAAGAAGTLATAAAKAAAAAEPATAAAPVLEDHYPVRKVSFPGGVTGHADVVYAQYPGYRPQILDVYVPRSRQGGATYPLIVHVHGGGWVGGHTRNSATFSDFPGVLASLAARGYVVASVEYRLGSEAGSPYQVQDVKAAIKWLRGHAQQYGIDPSRAAIWGGSAGGHLSALVGTSCGARELEPPADKDAAVAAASDCVQAVATWYGIFDMAPLAAQPNIMKLLGCAKDTPCTDDQVRMASPVRYLDGQDPPFLMIHGDSDKTVNVSQSRNFAAALEAAHVKGELLVIPGVDHSFVGATPEATHAAAIQALNRTIAFFDATVGAKRR